MLPDKFMALQDLDPKLQKPNPDQDPDPWSQIYDVGEVLRSCVS